MSAVREWLLLIKDLAMIATSIVAFGTLVVTLLKLRVEHPGHKLVLERELKLFDEVLALERALAPALTNKSVEASFERAALDEIRSMLKRYANDVYAPDDLRSALIALNGYLRDLDGSDLVVVSTARTLSLWKQCKSAMREHIELLATADRPYRLYIETPEKQRVFEAAFRSRRERQAYKKNNPTERGEYVDSGDDPPGIIRRYSR